MIILSLVVLIWYYIQFWFSRRTYHWFPWQICLCSKLKSTNCIIYFETHFPGIFELKYQNTCCIKNDNFITKILFTPITSISFVKTQNAQHFWEIMVFFCYFFIILIQYAKTLLVVNKYSYRMCAKIKKYVEISLLEVLKEDDILQFFFLLDKYFFDKLYIVIYRNCLPLVFNFFPKLIFIADCLPF